MKPTSKRAGLRLLFRVWRILSLTLTVLVALTLAGPGLGFVMLPSGVRLGLFVERLEPAFEENQLVFRYKFHNWWVFDLERVSIQVELLGPRGVVARGVGEASVPGLSQGIVTVKVSLPHDQAVAPLLVETRAHIGYALNLITLEVVVRERLA